MSLARLFTAWSPLGAGVATLALLVVTLTGPLWWTLPPRADAAAPSQRADALTDTALSTMTAGFAAPRPLRLLPARTQPAMRSDEGSVQADGLAAGASATPRRSAASAGAQIVGLLVCLAGVALVASSLLAWRIAGRWPGASNAELAHGR